VRPYRVQRIGRRAVPSAPLLIGGDSTPPSRHYVRPVHSRDTETRHHPEQRRRYHIVISSDGFIRTSKVVGILLLFL